MVEYIDKDKLRKAIYNVGGENFYTLGVLSLLQDFPASDVVPVIRCENCTFCEVLHYDDDYTKNVCRFLGRQIQDDDFCSNAVPKVRAKIDGEQK